MTPMEIAEAVRAACLRAAAGAHEDAGLQGLCAEGRWEAALCALRTLDLRPVAGACGAPESDAGARRGQPSGGGDWRTPGPAV